MSLSREIVSGLYGAFRLACADKSGLSLMGNSLESYWRSFWAAAFVAPFYLFFLWTEFDPETHEAGRFLLVNWLVYAMGWGLYPLAMFYITDMIDKAGEYKRFIIAYNWAAVFSTLFLFLISLVALSDLLPLQIMGFMRFMGLILVFSYIGFIARQALGVSYLAISGLIMMDFTISLFLNITAMVLA